MASILTHITSSQCPRLSNLVRLGVVGSGGGGAGGGAKGFRTGLVVGAGLLKPKAAALCRGRVLLL